MDREERRWERRIATMAAQAAVRGILDLNNDDTATLSAAMHAGDLLRVGAAQPTSSPASKRLVSA